jgi:hypothetical protein
MDACPYECVRSKPTPGASYALAGRHVEHRGNGQSERTPTAVRRKRTATHRTIDMSVILPVCPFAYQIVARKEKDNEAVLLECCYFRYLIGAIALDLRRSRNNH